MRDGIRERMGFDGKVTYQVKVAGTDPKTGKQRAVWRTFERKADAEARRDRLRVDREEGRLVFPASTTVAEWLTSYVAAKQTAATTRERYENLAAHVVDVLGTIKLQALTARDVERFRDALAREPYNYAPGTRRSAFVLLKAALARAVAQGALKLNPADGVEIPGVPEGETKSVLAPEDIGNLLRVLAGSDFWLPTAVLAYTGLRRGELCALRWRSIDVEAATLHVGGTVQRTKKNGLVIEAPKTTRSRRTIPIDAGLVTELRRHKAEQAAIGLQLGLAQTEDWLLFPMAPDRPTHPRTPNGFAQALARRLEKTRFAGVTPHDLRHAHGSALLADGESPKLVAQRLGHSVVELLKTYAHVLDRQAAAAADKFAAKVAGGGNGVPGAPGAEQECTVKLLKEDRY